MFDLVNEEDYGDYYHDYADDTLFLCPVLKSLMGFKDTGPLKASEVLRKLDVFRGKSTLSLLKEASLNTYVTEELEFEFEGKIYKFDSWYRVDVVNGKAVGCYGNARLLSVYLASSSLSNINHSLIAGATKRL